MGAWNTLCEDVAEDISSQMPAILSNRYPEDYIREIVDGWVPVYNGDLVDLLSDNMSLGYPDDSGLTEGAESVFAFLSITVSEELLQVAMKVYEDEKDDYEECIECGEWVNSKELTDGYCDDCFETACTCESCGNQFELEEIEFNEREMGERYCNKCAEEYADE